MSVFVDTNVLVYARDTREPAKQAQALAWMDHLWSSRDGRVNAQVLNEYYVTVTGRLRPGLTRAEARADIEELSLWNPQPIDADLILQALDLGDTASLSHWDALMLAGAHRAGSEFLLTEDLNDGQRIGAVTVISPFTHDPPAS